MKHVKIVTVEAARFSTFAKRCDVFFIHGDNCPAMFNGLDFVRTQGKARLQMKVKTRLKRSVGEMGWGAGKKNEKTEYKVHLSNFLNVGENCLLIVQKRCCKLFAEKKICVDIQITSSFS